MARLSAFIAITILGHSLLICVVIYSFYPIFIKGNEVELKCIHFALGILKTCKN